MIETTSEEQRRRGATAEPQPAADLLAEMREKAEAERREILDEAEAKVREIEERSGRECEAIERRALSELEAELKLERDRVLGEVRSAARAERLELKRSVMGEVFDGARAELERRIGGDGYREALEVLVREGLAFVGPRAEVKVAEEDAALCGELVTEKRLDCTVHGEPRSRGGMTLTSADGRRAVENGLSARLDRAAERLSADVARRLFG